MLLGILLLALVVFFVYMWNARKSLTEPIAGAGCNACGRKNVTLE
jgi:hypothetical protein